MVVKFRSQALRDPVSNLGATEVPGPPFSDDFGSTGGIAEEGPRSRRRVQPIEDARARRTQPPRRPTATALRIYFQIL